MKLNVYKRAPPPTNECFKFTNQCVPTTKSNQTKQNYGANRIKEKKTKYIFIPDLISTF